MTGAVQKPINGADCDGNLQIPDGLRKFLTLMADSGEQIGHICGLAAGFQFRTQKTGAQGDRYGTNSPQGVQRGQRKCVILGPDSHVVRFFDAQREQRSGGLINKAIQFGIGQAAIGVDHSHTFRIARCNCVQNAADGFVFMQMHLITPDGGIPA